MPGLHQRWGNVLISPRKSSRPALECFPWEGDHFNSVELPHHALDLGLKIITARCIHTLAVVPENHVTVFEIVHQVSFWVSGQGCHIAILIKFGRQRGWVMVSAYRGIG